MTPACYALSAAVDALQRVDQRMRREGLGPKLASAAALTGEGPRPARAFSDQAAAGSQPVQGRGHAAPAAAGL